MRAPSSAISHPGVSTCWRSYRCRPISINALAKLLKRNYKNVHDDVKALESIGLIERGEDGRYSVPWDEINTSFMHEQ